MELKEVFNNVKTTENGDLAFKSTGNKLIDILFMTEYYSKHLDEVPNIGTSEKAKLFSMFIRDPRFGIGKRDLGRLLMNESAVYYENIIKAGRYDDLWHIFFGSRVWPLMSAYLKQECAEGNYLAKKWMPRYSSKNLMIAREIAKDWGMNKQQYGKFIKCNTTECQLSEHREDDVIFEHVPSLAMLKYAKTFATKEAFSNRYGQYLEDVKAGKKDLKVSTTTVYDIYKNRDKIDPDLFFSKIEKISGNWIPIVDTSGSMMDSNDSYGKALALGHYLAKCSSYAPNQVVSFSSKPTLLSLKEDNEFIGGWRGMTKQDTSSISSQYLKEIERMYTGDCSNTDFGAVMDLLVGLDKNAPEYLIVLSDMEFDQGSRLSKQDTMRYFRSIGVPTKIIWWNLNSRATTCPETDADGNIFISGYNPLILKYLKVGFDAHQFLDELLDEYKKNVGI